MLKHFKIDMLNSFCGGIKNPIDNDWCVFQKNGRMKSHSKAQKAEVQMVLNFFSARL